MILLVTGGRDYTDQQAVWRALGAIHARTPITLLVQGGANGADACAKRWAIARGVHCAQVDAIWRPDGETLDRGAGAKRNAAMLRLNPGGVIAFPGGTGTADMVAKARKAGIKVWEPYA